MDAMCVANTSSTIRWPSFAEPLPRYCHIDRRSGFSREPLMTAVSFAAEAAPTECV